MQSEHFIKCLAISLGFVFVVVPGCPMSCCCCWYCIFSLFVSNDDVKFLFYFHFHFHYFYFWFSSALLLLHFTTGLPRCAPVHADKLNSLPPACCVLNILELIGMPGWLASGTSGLVAWWSHYCAVCRLLAGFVFLLYCCCYVGC